MEHYLKHLAWKIFYTVMLLIEQYKVEATNLRRIGCPVGPFTGGRFRGVEGAPVPAGFTC